MPVFRFPKFHPNHNQPTDLQTSGREWPEHQTLCSATIHGGTYSGEFLWTFGYVIPLCGAKFSLHMSRQHCTNYLLYVTGW